MSESHQSCPTCESSNIRKVNQFIIKDIWRCGDCDLAFFANKASNAEISAFYATYPRDHYESSITALRYNNLLTEFEQLSGGRKILDYGCNSGFFLDVARKSGWNAIGAEISSEAREICQKRNLEVMDLDRFYKMPAVPILDVITSFEVIEHMTYPATFFQKAFELLKPGGIVYVTTPNFDSLERRCLGDKYDIVNFPEHLCFFNARSLRNCASAAGFSTHKILTTGISLTRIRTSKKISSEKYVSETSTDEQIRIKTETSSVLKTAKALANFALNQSRLGNSLKGYFVKPMEK
ncbi:MAG: class I SAM-dependent methyltransferase [Flavobacteriales bacterium]|nr:class I SAM-dependent methyltransferase [Flavobacteriales bacterium]